MNPGVRMLVITRLPEVVSVFVQQGNKKIGLYKSRFFYV